MLKYLIAFIFLLPTTVFAELQVSDAWIKHLPPPVPVRAGYMTLSNSGENTATIRAIRSDAFAGIEIHRTLEQDGMMHMEQVPALTIEADSTVQLAPGGLHLMMMQPVAPTEPGDVIQITIILDDGTEQNLNMTVKK